ncbi:hypothetical protein OH77DRAFT_1411619, partial [Trametes cingulata]
ALVVYDALLCLGQEIPLVWGNAKPVASLLYICTRYVFIVWMVLPLFTAFPVSSTVSIRLLSSWSAFASHMERIPSCTAISWSVSFAGVLARIGPSVFASLRVYVLTGRNRLLFGIILALNVAPTLISLVSSLR